MSKLYSIKRFGVLLLEFSWALFTGLYGPVRLVVLILGSLASALWAFFWVFAAVFDVPPMRHQFGTWFCWSLGGTLVLMLLGDLLFRRRSK